MKIEHEDQLNMQILEGEKGSVTVKDFLKEKETIGIRIIPQNSIVPTRSHIHTERQVNYVIEGRAEVSNGIDAVLLKKGDFVFFESSEQHYFKTFESEIKLFEVKF
ncbi:MAG: cupin domain-containing protein [Candidatus Heimdallarchaeota archaeon]